MVGRGCFMDNVFYGQWLFDGERSFYGGEKLFYG